MQGLDANNGFEEDMKNLNDGPIKLEGYIREGAT